MPKWDWLKQRKQQAMLEKQQKPINFAQMPVGARYPTGNGQDGVMQPNMPVAQVPTTMGPRMLHEGEEARKMPGGNVNVVSQRELVEEEKTKNIPGYQQGGTFRPVGQRTPMGQTGTAQPPRQTTSPTPNPPWKKPKPFGIGSKGNKNPNIVGPDQQGIQDITPDNINPNIVGPDQQNIPNINPDGSIINPDIVGPLDINKPPNLINDNVGPGEKKLDDLGFIKKDQQNIDGGQIDYLPKPDPDFQEGQKQDWIPKPDPNVDPNVDPNDPDYEDEFNKAIGRIGQIDSNEAAYKKYLDDMAARQATEELVGQQRLAQAGVGGVEGRTAGMMMGREHGMEMGELAAQGGIKQMELEEQAAVKKAQLALEGMKFKEGSEQWQKTMDFAKQKYGDQMGMQIGQLVGQGYTLKQIQDMFPDAGITQEDYDSMKSMSQMGWEQESFKQQMDFAEKQYGDQAGARIAELVNQGHSLKYIQSQYPDANITQEDYDQMQDWSPTGFIKDQWDYDKKVDSLNMLLQQGGPDNYKAAQDLAREMFGVDVDFSNALTEENTEKFNTSWNGLIGAISGGTSFEDWKKGAIASGEYENLNMTDEDIEEMYGNMALQNNPIYQSMQQYDKMLEEGIIDQVEYDRIIDALTYGLSHPEGFTYSDSFQILDGQGNEVKNFKTQEEADAYMADNQGQGYTINQEKDGWVEYTGGDTVDPDDPDVVDPDVISDEDWEKMDDSAKNEHWLDNVPEQFLDEWDTKDGYTKWVNAGMPQNWKEYQDYLDANTGDFTKTQQDKYKEDGWAVPDYSDYLNPDSKKLAEDGIKKGREDFLAGGDNVHSISTTDLEELQHSGIYGDPKFTTPGSVFSFEGMNPMAVAYLSPPDGIVFYDLVTGKEVRMGKAPSGLGVTFS